MSFYTRTAVQLFGGLSSELSVFFPDLAEDLKRAGIKISNKEYISLGVLTSAIFLLAEIPILSFIFGIIFRGVLISLITSITAAGLLTFFIFYLFTKYPKTAVADRSKKIDAYLPFASLFLSTIASSELPLDKVFKMFGKYSKYGEITEQIQMLNTDVDLFGLDIHSALERAVHRSPSKRLREMLWGILSTSVAGGDVSVYLREKSAEQMEDYRRSINKFSRTLTFFIEIYLTAIVLGAIFLIVVTSIFTGIAGVGTNLITLQALIIFVFLPLISVLFIILIKLSSPTGD